MHSRLSSLIAIRYLCLLLITLLVAPTPAQASDPAIRAGEVTPINSDSEVCKSSSSMNTIIRPSRDLPYWLFLINFDVWLKNTYPLGCVLLYAPGKTMPMEQALQVTCEVKGKVDWDAQNGQATFTEDGYVRCPINLMEAVNNRRWPVPIKTKPIKLDKEYHYPHFMIKATGRLKPGASTDKLPGNLFLAYHRTLKKTSEVVPDVALFAPLDTSSGSAISGQLVTRYRTTWSKLVIATCSFEAQVVESPLEHWQMNLHPRALRLTPPIGKSCIASKKPAVNFWTNGGEFLIGGSHLEPEMKLNGVLDEVIVDPTGSIKEFG